jgi:hypothetical protein
MTNNKSGPLRDALEDTANSAEMLVEELRMMAAGEGEYSRFLYVSPLVKGIWHAAADWIESANNRRLH